MLVFKSEKFRQDLRDMAEETSYRHMSDMTFGAVKYPTMWRIANMETASLKMDDVVNLCNFLGMHFEDYIAKVGL